MTARQRLINHVVSQVRQNNLKVLLQNHGEQFTIAGYNVTYSKIEPGTVAMNEVIDESAVTLGGAVKEYYFNLSDIGYKRLENEIGRKAQ